ncbi:MAG: ATP-binding protein [Nanoarchaeota archaeon]
MAKKYVLTGSAYSGKTSTLNELARHGFSIVPEAATLVISEQLAVGGDILPWAKLDAFLEALIEKQLELEAKIPADSEIAFLDRGIPDELAYFRYYGTRTKVPVAYVKAFQEHRYDGVFVFDLIPGYQQDKIRREPLEMVRQLRILHEETYRELGYDVAVVPFMSIRERVNFVIDRI